jgi:very-short-patch-repair endonuclease
LVIEPRVKYLRENATEPERLLWAQLRRKRAHDARFRRQYGIGPYIVDFVCLSARLIVEVDGDSHDQTFEADARRTEWLEGQQFRVLRFSNREVRDNLDGVVRSIMAEMSETLDPSPFGRRKLHWSFRSSPSAPPARGGGKHI